jgi:hypothetical protein
VEVNKLIIPAEAYGGPCSLAKNAPHIFCFNIL